MTKELPKEMTRDELNKSAMMIGLLMTAIGLLLVVGSNGRFGPDIAVTMFVVGIGFAGFGGVVIWKGVQFSEQYLTQKGVDIVDEVTDESLMTNNRAIVWVWIVALTTWAIMAVAYFSLSMLVYMVLDSVEGMYAFGEQELGIITLTKNVTGWFLIIMTVGIIGWALINSARREDQTYPI